ncbi:hypothetical protein AB0E10_19410 [Streptomyces sp. NPDC048045]|uniref:hypothetical protein n=1 Tax=Streptomyces sp. NPDC048045 TaxID=3154710 RepID=UPI003426B330
MRASRPLATLTGIALLGITLAACQDQAGGQITARNGVRLVDSFTNPSVHGCHPFSDGVTRVENYSQSSILLYTTPDCTAPPGGTGIYLSMQSSDEVVRSTGLWRSFSIAPE